MSYAYVVDARTLVRGKIVLSLFPRVALKSVVWIAIYTLGYFDFSVAWLATPLLLSVMRFVFT